LTAGDAAAMDWFGSFSVALAGDTALVGAFRDDDAGSESGSAYIFNLNDYNQWGQQAKLTAVVDDSAAESRFGYDVSLDGDTALVGAYGYNCPGVVSCGAVYVLTRSGSNWSHQAKLLASDGAANDLFGFSTAISGDTALIGAIGADCPAGSNCGAAYVFTRSGAAWSQQAKLTPMTQVQEVEFGISVSLDDDTALVGAYLDDDCPVGLNCGSAYVFTGSGATWTEQQKLKPIDPEPGAQFGISVSLKGDTALVGSDTDDCLAGADCGSAYVFTRSGASWSQHDKLVASDFDAGQNFGRRVSLVEGMALIGAWGDDCTAGADCGAAYVFTQTGVDWNEQSKLTASDADQGDEFGISVALTGETALIGSRLNDCADGVGCGSAYVFTRSGMTWNEQMKLTASDASADDQLGRSVAVDGDTALIGAWFADSDSVARSGAAYFYTFPCGFGKELQADAWHLVGSPCAPNLPGTVASTYGDELPGSYASRWVVYGRDATTDAYVAYAETDPIDPGVGTWIKTLDPPTGTGNRVFVEGTVTPVLGTTGCVGTQGCYVIPLTPPDDASELYNLVGHPFPFGVDWANVRLRVDGTTYLSPTDALAQNVMDKTYWVWNGNAYESYDDATPMLEGTLQAFDGLWIKLLPGSQGKTLELLIPATPSVKSSQVEAEVPWYLSWMQALEALIPTATASDFSPQANTWGADRNRQRWQPPPAEEWAVRLTIEEPETGMRDRSNVLGQLKASKRGYDPHDLVELAPFGDTYLTIVFPHPHWGEHAGDYTSDFHKLPRDPRWGDVWEFEIRSDALLSDLRLSWDGPQEILERSVIIDRDMNQRIPATERVYDFYLDGKPRTLRWRYRGQASPQQWWR
ncbi:MAG: FG-GAP repeat protein, partial [Gammaproteobacteria bacterium]|nr:FG-GAP repeat protein [Gammaproteobacteria bacterium]